MRVRIRAAPELTATEKGTVTVKTPLPRLPPALTVFAKIKELLLNSDALHPI
jgi:hypothetical protein